MELGTLEWLAFWLGAAAITLTVLGALTGALAWYFSEQRNIAKDAEAVRLKGETDARIAEANATAASANQIAERERLERLKLEARLAPRVITPERKAAMATALKSLGAFSVQVIAYSDVAEVGRLTQGLTATLTEAGWKFAVSTTLGGGGVTVQGIAVAVKKDASQAVRAAADRLVAELRSSGVGASFVSQTIESIPVGGLSYGHTVPAAQVEILVLIGNK